MGSGKPPGHLCSSKGDVSIKDGTNCRGASPKPGSIGLMTQEEKDLAEARAMDAEMKAKEVVPTSSEDVRKVIEEGIQHIIDSPFYEKKEGKAIVALVRDLNANGHIVFASVSGDRASWDGTTMRLDTEFAGRPLAIAVELVHEGTHVLWRKNHQKKSKDVMKDNIDDEFHAQENQLVMYGYMVDLGLRDLLLKTRLEQYKARKLRGAIEKRMKEEPPEVVR